MAIRRMPEIPADLPPLQTMILEVLAARYRLGERMWTFPARLRPALNALQDRDLIWWKSGVAERTCQAFLTDAGMREALYDDYVNPADRAEAKLAEIRKWTTDIMRRKWPLGEITGVMPDLRQELVEILDRP